MEPLGSSSFGLDGSALHDPNPIGHALMPLARVQKLETQMKTLMQHNRPWMKKIVKESEKRVEHDVEDDGGDVVLNALFSEDEPTLDPPRVAGSPTRASERTTNTHEERRAKKKQVEAAQR
uniref:Integrase core domain containing protein n=1 Tax=Solanum tuberosum TaxID=4113 RepID=M1D7Y6_SOLTU